MQSLCLIVLMVLFLRSSLIREKINKFSIFSKTLSVYKRTISTGLLVNEDISTKNILSFIKKILELQY